MTDAADVLEQYLVAIETTDYRKLAQWEKLHIVRAMRLLAAEVRALREKLAFEKAKRDQFVAEALAITTEQEAENVALRERLAAQERLAGSAVTTDDALRVWMQRMERASGQALDVRLATALACITELEVENAALRRQTCGE
jgi:hypothetical protein